MAAHQHLAFVNAVWTGALGWELVFNLPFDIVLLLSGGWRSPSRALTRFCYYLCRYGAFGVQVAQLCYWTSERCQQEGCQGVVNLFNFLISFSYNACFFIVLSQAIAIFPGDLLANKISRAIIILSFLNVASWTGAIPIVKWKKPKLEYDKSAKQKPSSKNFRHYERGLSSSMLAYILIVLVICWIRMGPKLARWRQIVDAFKRRESGPDCLMLLLIGQGLFFILVVLVTMLAKVVIVYIMDQDSELRHSLTLSVHAMFALQCGTFFRETFKLACEIRRTPQPCATDPGAKSNHDVERAHDPSHDEVEEILDDSCGKHTDSPGGRSSSSATDQRRRTTEASVSSHERGSWFHTGDEPLAVNFRAFDEGGDDEDIPTLGRVSMLGWDSTGPRNDTMHMSALQRSNADYAVSLPPPPRRSRRRTQLMMGPPFNSVHA